MFEDKALADQAVHAVEKTIHHEDMGHEPEPKPVQAGQAKLVEEVSKDQA